MHAFAEPFKASLHRLLFAACLVFGVSCTKTQEVKNRVVVNVDGQELKASVFSAQLADRLKHLDALTAKDPMVVQRTKDGLLRDFIISVLTESWAKRNGVFVRAEDLDREIERVRKGYPDKESFERALADQNLTFKEWKEQLSNSLLQRLVIVKLGESSSAPADEEIKSHYQSNKESFERPEQVQLRQVVLATESDAKSVQAELKKGTSLAELATKYSITPEGKRNKGDLGWIEKGVMEGFDAAFSMRVGQRSDVIKSPYGYHIFEVLGKRPATTLGIEAVREKIKRSLMANREQAVFTAWLEGELRRARVLKDDDLIRQIRIETKGE